MKTRVKNIWAVLVLGFAVMCSGLAVQADFRPANTTIEHHNFQVDGTTKLVGNVTQNGNSTINGNHIVGGTLAVTGTSTLTGNTTVGGTLGVTGATTFTVPLTVANVGNAVKRRFLMWYPNNGQVLADGTTYAAFLFPGEAGTVKQVMAGTHVIPAGTNTLKVLKGAINGNTMLSTATFDPHTLVADTGTSVSLTATGADLGITATQPIYVEWVSGTQTTAATRSCVTIEFEPTDY